MKTGGAHIFKFVVARSFTVDGNLHCTTNRVKSSLE